MLDPGTLPDRRSSGPTPSAAARARMESGRWEPLFKAAWDRTLNRTVHGLHGAPGSASVLSRVA